jgi:hypothetical protein
MRSLYADLLIFFFAISWLGWAAGLAFRAMAFAISGLHKLRRTLQAGMAELAAPLLALAVRRGRT